MFLIGHLLRLQRGAPEQAQRLLEEEERTRDARNEAAALEERGRIAREMHDVLAHSLSALAVQLEGARLLARDRERRPGGDRRDRARPPPRRRRASTRRGAAIETLRGDAVPGPDRLAELASSVPTRRASSARSRSAASRAGSPPRRRLAIYRTAQEALTNVRKHAGRRAGVDLRLDYDPDGYALIVEDSTGAARGAARSRRRWPARAPATGVSGMRERAELIGGRLLAGPTADGFRVELWVPA